MKKSLSSMLSMWKEVMEDNEGFRVIDFVEVYGDALENLLHKLVSEEAGREASSERPNNLVEDENQ